MIPDLAIWSFLKQNLLAGEPAMLLYVVESAGSSPGRQGFCMAVNAAGKMEGSIGGGMMEHKLVELAKVRLRQLSAEPLLRRQVHRKEAATDQSGMICSGEQTVLVYPVGTSDLATLEAMEETLSAGAAGALEVTANGMRFEPGPTGDFSFDRQPWRMRVPLGVRPRIHIVGGGHCALALSRQMDFLRFEVQVYENRPGLHTLDQNRWAHQKHLLPDYRALASCPLREEDHLVVMTFGYRTDAEVLRALAGRTFRYLGVLGSQKKIGQLWSEFRAEGIDRQWLDSIHAPVGLPIKSETPEEIAVSIAAQIIRVRNTSPTTGTRSNA